MSPIAGGASHIIITTGDRFMNALEINDLFEQESPVGQLYVRLKELGITVERERNMYNQNSIKIQGIYAKFRAGGVKSDYGYKFRPKLEEA